MSLNESQWVSMSLNESKWVSMSINWLGSFDHLPRVQETSLVSYRIPVSYCIPVSYRILASAYGLKAISDWFCKKQVFGLYWFCGDVWGRVGTYHLSFSLAQLMCLMVWIVNLGSLGSYTCYSPKTCFLLNKTWKTKFEVPNFKCACRYF